jgi:uncharacterized protein YaaR (DUF327 family)
MIEIIQPGHARDDKSKIKSKKKSSAVGKSGLTFAAELQNAVAFDIHGTLDDLLEDLSEQEKRFMNTQSEYEMGRYKALIKKILKSILQDGVKVQSLKRPPSKSGKAPHVIIKEIDEKLLAVSQAVTKHNRAFNMMKTIEEIRGLILDLVY